MAEFVVVYKEVIVFRQIVEADSKEDAIEYAKDNPLPRSQYETEEFKDFHIEGENAPTPRDAMTMLLGRKT